MKTRLRRSDFVGRAVWTGVVASNLALAGCGLSGVNIPNPTGPSERNISLMVMANPDVVQANGVSTSAIGIIARDVKNEAIVNLQVYMQLNGPGLLDREYIVTDARGMGSVTYTSPFGVYGTVTVSAHPVGLDFGSELDRSVTLDLVPPTP